MGEKLPSMKARDFIALLCRKPLGYEVVHQRGSHRRLRSDDYPPLTFAFHDSDTLGGTMIKKILVKSVGLTPDEIDALL